MTHRAVVVILGLILAVAGGCQPSPDALRAEVDAFLADYTAEYVPLYTRSAEAEWASNTRIVEGDDTNLERTEAANRAFAEFTGSVAVVEKARAYLERADQLEPLQVRQLEAVLYQAADNPQTVADLVDARITAEAKQTEALFGFDFQIDGRSVSTNEIDARLAEETDLERRRAVWEASKEVGPPLRDGLVTLVDLRNRKSARAASRGGFAGPERSKAPPGLSPLDPSIPPDMLPRKKSHRKIRRRRAGRVRVNIPFLVIL